MTSIFKRQDRRPIPEGAEITTRRGQKVVRFKDDRGRTQTHTLSEDDSCMLVERRAWYVAYVDASGNRQIVKAYSEREATEHMAQELERQLERDEAAEPEPRNREGSNHETG
jgi:hypothetical protein